jgi:hypothetical protein
VKNKRVKRLSGYLEAKRKLRTVDVGGIFGRFIHDLEVFQAAWTGPGTFDVTVSIRLANTGW